MLCVTLKSQVKYAAHWYFGYKAGIDFNSGAATVDVSGQLESIEGCSSISDNLGNLLFYSNGEDVWDKNHLLMTNGTGLFGDQSSAQSSIIVPKPGSNTLYYLFTTKAIPINISGFYYNIIDMSLNSGNGDVNASKNVVLFAGTNTEELAATKACNNIDYWVVVRQDVLNCLKFRAYKVSSTGISAPIISQFFVPNPQYNTVGGLTFSQDGSILTFSSFVSDIYIFNFNKGTGQLTLQTSIPISQNEMVYSNALSPDKTKLYTTTWVNGSKNYVSQFDLTASNIPASRKNLDSVDYSNGSPNGYGFLGAVRLAPDQKIYFSRWHQQSPFVTNPNSFFSLDSLGVINAPNLSALSCNFQRNGFYLNHQPTMIGLPNFVSNFTSTVAAIPNPLPPLSLNNSTLCNGSSFTLTVNNPSSASITYTWLPGGSTTNTFVVTPAVTNNYSVIVNVNGCDLLLSNTVTVLHNTVTVNNPTICKGNTATLVANSYGNPSYTYTWLPTGTTSPTLIVSPTATGFYTLLATNNSNNCNSIVVNTVTVYDAPLVTMNNPTITCGSTTTLVANATPSVGVFYSWLPAGPLTNTNIVSPAATSVYSLMATLNGCNKVFSNTVTVNTTNAITNFLYANAFCKKDTIVFPQTSVSFNTGGTFSSPGLNIDPNNGTVDLSSAIAGTYVVNYNLAPGNCISAGNSTANIVILPSPDLIVSDHLNILPGTSTTLSVSGGISYTWTPENYLSCINCEYPVATPPDNIQYCVLSALNSCISKKCIDIIVSCETGNDHSVPNAFTPNGDGHNDAFCLQGWTDCITNFNVMIFDRWGEKVFESNDASFCWDGFYKGELMNAGVFAYVIKATKNKEQINKKGNITLIR